MITAMIMIGGILVAESAFGYAKWKSTGSIGWRQAWILCGIAGGWLLGAAVGRINA